MDSVFVWSFYKSGVFRLGGKMTKTYISYFTLYCEKSFAEYLHWRPLPLALVNVVNLQCSVQCTICMCLNIIQYIVGLHKKELENLIYQFIKTKPHIKDSLYTWQVGFGKVLGIWRGIQGFSQWDDKYNLFHPFIHLQSRVCTEPYKEGQWCHVSNWAFNVHDFK